MHAEHGFNASTFTARVVASTYATCYCSISAGIGALSGPLHGGANEPVLEMIDEIGSLDNVSIHGSKRPSVNTTRSWVWATGCTRPRIPA